MMLMLLTGQRVRRYWLYRSCRSTAALGRQEAALTSAFCGHEADEMASALTPMFYSHGQFRKVRLSTTRTRCFTSGWVGPRGLAIGTMSDGADFRNERVECGRHGTGSIIACRNSLKRGYGQADGHRRDSGRGQSRHPCAIRGAGPLCDDARANLSGSFGWQGHSNSMMAALFIIYIVVRRRINPVLRPVLPASERDIPRAPKINRSAARGPGVSSSLR
jgi:hypothetical protein